MEKDKKDLKDTSQIPPKKKDLAYSRKRKRRYG